MPTCRICGAGGREGGHIAANTLLASEYRCCDEVNKKINQSVVLWSRSTKDDPVKVLDGVKYDVRFCCNGQRSVRVGWCV